MSRTPINSELYMKVSRKIDQCIAIAGKTFNRTFIRPEVTFDLTGQIAGQACPSTNSIKINRVLFEENVEAFLERTVPHEFAHIVDAKVNPHTQQGRKRSFHGPTWKRIMVLFDAPVSRCHSYDTTNTGTKRKNKFSYGCGCVGEKHIISSVIHNRIRQGRIYRCRSCKDPISLQEALGQVSYKEIYDGKKQHKKKKVSRTGSKIAKALLMYKENPGIDRLVLIGMFCVDLNMSLAGARTYYANVKKRISAEA